MLNIRLGSFVRSVDCILNLLEILWKCKIIFDCRRNSVDNPKICMLIQKCDPKTWGVRRFCAESCDNSLLYEK